MCVNPLTLSLMSPRVSRWMASSQAKGHLPTESGRFEGLLCICGKIKINSVACLYINGGRGQGSSVGE